MALPKFSSPFPRLDLTLDDKKQLCRIAKQLVSEVVDGYERFLWNDHEQLNSARWLLVKEREDVRVYHDRLSGARSSPDRHQNELNVLLTVGTVQGSLDDALYGVISHTTDAMRVKTAYTKDMISNCAVLAPIQEPTLDKPFRSMAVKWGVKTLPLHLRALSKKRDFVFLECVGTRTLANGETVAFQLLHSVDFKTAPPLPQYVRTNFSICSVWRQQAPDRTQVFIKSFLDIRDRILAPLALRTSAETLVTVGKFMHVAQMKKLTWLMRRRRASVACSETESETESCNDGYAPHSSSTSGGSTCCAICGTSQSTNSRASRHHHGSSTKSHQRCTICTRVVCATCRVRRDLCYVAPDSRLVETRAAFCVPCLSLSARAATVDVARDEIVGEDGGGGSRSAEVAPLLSALVQDCNGSITRFSYSSSSSYSSTSHAERPVAMPHESRKRRSMSIAAPLKHVASYLSSSASVSSLASRTAISTSSQQTPTTASRDAWTPRTGSRKMHASALFARN